MIVFHMTPWRIYGTWGADNFENDGAYDYRDSISYQLIRTIEACFQTEMGYDLDEGGETELVPSVAMLVVLCEHCHAHSPKTDTVREWRERYLQIYDNQIMYDGPNVKHNLRASFMYGCLHHPT